MSSLRSSRGYSSVTLDRLRYGNIVDPGVLAVGNNGVVGVTGALNMQNLNVTGTSVINNAVITTATINNATIATATINTIDVTNATINTIDVTNATINTIDATNATIRDTIYTDTISPYTNGSTGTCTFTANVSVDKVITAPVAEFEDVIVGSNLGIGVGAAVHALDVKGQVYISGTGPAEQIFTTPGRYTIRIPKGAGIATVTLVGAGGNGAAGAGYGGYIKGTFDTMAYVEQTLTIQVGEVGGTSPAPYVVEQPSSASFISFVTGGPIIAMAGAGGGDAEQGLTVTKGGHGGGGIARFINIGSGSVAIGTDGEYNSVDDTTGGQGGQTGSGGASGTMPNGFVPGTAGSGRPVVETYVDVTGGFGGDSIPGGNGYTSGGSAGGGGGGGSSYINSAFTLSDSLRGDDITYNTTVPQGFGRSNQNGYVSIRYNIVPSLYTSGDIVSDGTFISRSPDIPGSTGAAGSTGQFSWDSDYFYVCVGHNDWKRAALSYW